MSNVPRRSEPASSVSSGRDPQFRACQSPASAPSHHACQQLPCTGCTGCTMDFEEQKTVRQVFVGDHIAQLPSSRGGVNLRGSGGRA